ncbi:glycosyltransferase [Actinopolymorpha rutila]
MSFFAERGHDVHLLTCGMSGHPTDGYRLHDLGVPWPGKLGYLGRISATRRILRGLRPDLVHAHYATSYGALAVGAGVRPLIVTAHGDDVLDAPRHPAKRPVVRWVLRRADLVTVPADHMRDAVDKVRGGVRAPVLVFQYGVEAERLARLCDGRRTTGRTRPTRPLRIVSARPLMRLYRVDLLLAALSILKRRDIAFECEIIGDGPDRRRLSRICDRAGLTGLVRFLGTLPPAKVEEHFARADLAVSLSSRDGASLAVLEAMALGAIPVLSDIPANRPWAGPMGAVLVGTKAADVADGIIRGAALDRETAAGHNRRIVLARADLATNLGRFEGVMEALRLGNRITEGEG